MDDLKRKATSSTLITGLALAGLLVSEQEYLYAVIVYGIYVLKETVIWWQRKGLAGERWPTST